MSQATPDLTASIDQMGATLRSMTTALGTYRAGLIAAGLSQAAADEVVVDYARRTHAAMLPTPNPFSGLFPGAGS